MFNFFRTFFAPLLRQEIRREFYTFTGVMGGIGTFAYDAKLKREEYILSLGQGVLNDLNKSHFESADFRFNMELSLSNLSATRKWLIKNNLAPLFSKQQRILLAKYVEIQYTLIDSADPRLTHPKLRKELAVSALNTVKLAVYPDVLNHYNGGITSYIITLCIIHIYKEGLTQFLSDGDLKNLHQFQAHHIDLIKEIEPKLHQLSPDESVPLISEIFHRNDPSKLSYQVLIDRFAQQEELEEEMREMEER
jgi:hypothetical protein